MVCITFVELESLVLHAKFQDYRPSGSGGQDIKGFYYSYSWRPSKLCKLDHLYNFLFPLPKDAPHKVWF